MEIRAKAQSPEHLTLRKVNGSEKASYWRCAADFKTSAVADEHGDTDSPVTRGATDWPVGAASRETPAPQPVTDATATAHNVAYLIMSIAGFMTLRHPSWYESRDTRKKWPVLVSVHVTPDGALTQVITPSDFDWP